MNVSEKLALNEEFKRSKLKVGGFARKRMISDTVMRRLVADETAGKINEFMLKSLSLLITPKAIII